MQQQESQRKSLNWEETLATFYHENLLSKQSAVRTCPHEADPYIITNLSRAALQGITKLESEAVRLNRLRQSCDSILSRLPSRIDSHNINDVIQLTRTLKDLAGADDSSQFSVKTKG